MSQKLEAQASIALNERVKDYYNQNTPIFVKIGRSSASANIHRAVWGKDVKTEVEAMTYVNFLIKKELEQIPAPNQVNVMDLGCGVGAPLFYLHQKVKKNTFFTGISISDVQINMANKFKDNEHPGFNGKFITADFHDIPVGDKQHLIYMVEAFIHANNPSKLLKGIAERLEKGGKLIICDDFLPNNSKALSEREATILSNYKSGWQVGSLMKVDAIADLASQYELKLTQNTDLTTYLNLWTLRDKFANFFLFFYNLLPFRSNYWESIKGGDALQKGLLNGLINYRYLVFTKS